MSHFPITQISDYDVSNSDGSDDDEQKNIQQLINLTKDEFGDLQQSFKQYGKVDVSQFVSIFMELKSAEISTLVYLYQLIDTYESNSISFEQFSNFLVDMHDWLNRDQSMYQVRLKERQVGVSQELNPIEKLFDLKGFDQFAYLEQNLRQLRVLDPLTFEESINISIGNTTIIAVLYIKPHNSLLISSNDKFLNFFDLQSNKLQRRFMVPEIQTQLQYSEQKSVIYTGTSGGTIYSWDLDKIFSKQYLEFLKSTPKIQDCFKVVILQQPICEQDGLTCLLNIDSLEILVSGSNDSVIRLFENRKQLSSNHKCLRGHKKAIKQFSYCPEFKYLISCSYDFDVFVWNIYLEHPLAKLMGHEASLVSVLSITNRVSLLVSCDVKGNIRLWDPKTFQALQHIKADDGKQIVKSIMYKEEQNIIIVGFKGLLVYQFEESFDPNLTDEYPIQCMCYADKYMEMHLATSRHIKTWDVRSGLIKRVNKSNYLKDNLQTFVLDGAQRRGFLGSHDGTILCIDLFTGFLIGQINEFTSEVSYLGYSDSYQLLIGASWDKQIKILKDGDKYPALRVIRNSHQSEITCGAFSENLLLLATSAKLNEIRIWDFEKGTFNNKLKSIGEIICLKFLDPYPLLASSDHLGQVIIHIMTPHNQANRVAIIWKNMFTIMKAAQVNSIEHYDDQLILGDENGDVRIISIKEVLTQLNLKPINHKDVALNRNPMRYFQLNFQEYQQTANDNQSPLLGERTAYQVSAWRATKSAIKQMALVKQTKPFILLTVSSDLQVQLWNLKGQLVGIFRQGANQTNALNLKVQPKYKTKSEQLCQVVQMEYPKIIHQRELKKKPYPFCPVDEDRQTLASVNSQDIFKTLKELEKMQEKQHKRM